MGKPYSARPERDWREEGSHNFSAEKFCNWSLKTFSEGIVPNERFEAEKLVFTESEILCRETSNNFRWEIIASHLIRYLSVLIIRRDLPIINNILG